MIIPKTSFLEEVTITPAPDEYQVNPVSLDLRIGEVLQDPVTRKTKKLHPKSKVFIEPGQHFLIQTMEKIGLPTDIMGVVCPRSSTNRRGITVDMTGVVDPGYSGHLMIPVSNLTCNTVMFYPGERIAQIIFHRLEAPVAARVSKYQDSGMEAKPDKAIEIELLESGWLFEDKVYEKRKK